MRAVWDRRALPEEVGVADDWGCGGDDTAAVMTLDARVQGDAR